MTREPIPPNALDSTGHEIWTVFGERGPLKSFATEEEAYTFAQEQVGNGERVWL